MGGCAQSARRAPRLEAFGHWMRRNRAPIQAVQWVVVGVYAFLLIVPALLPLPSYQDHILTNLTVFAAFVFWGLWWPFVLISMVLLGRVWCGVFCPEGTLTEAASRVGLGRAIPKWLRWEGWPFIGFLGTTLYGQMASVYQYPTGALAVLGGSTVAAVAVGLIYGRGTRVWCRHLCPVNGVFMLLSKLAPVHFRTDKTQWAAFNREHSGEAIRHETVHCPPLVPLKQLQSASPCHMCGKCSGHKGAITLTARSSADEVVFESATRATRADFILLAFGLFGVAIGAFHWSASPWFVAVKQAVAMWLVEHDILWPLTTHAPWWLLTNYPAQNDVFNLLDGALLIGYILTTALVMGLLISTALALTNRLIGRWSWQRLWHLSHALIPLGGLGVFLGLTATTVTLLRGDGLTLFWLNDARAALLAAGTLWSLYLGARIIARHTVSTGRRGLALAGLMLSMVPVLAAWWLMFWGW
ncbi:4Fe-4S binding protein [Larsenimonas suaedae]|uniref:4Fe-4S binding protein n=1 Tax=Larsenimonas suaedae TaxID=1851019 RepID=A0ABU1GTF1_9GAMM|nr:4Fe-4S binding protein [Larsenimonas suaedae]MCM2972358.1 4Fe-4S binding protein [Larsenimonas suaedae]MDR5894846.1 4Fe-4S binding protein [Larsenimonas suaedae]